MYPVTRDRTVEFRPGWDFRDLGLLVALLALFLGIVRTAAQFAGAYDYTLQIQASLAVVPAYSVVLDFLGRSPTLRLLSTPVWQLLNRVVDKGTRQPLPPRISATNLTQHFQTIQGLNRFFFSGVTFIVLWGTWEVALLLRVLHWSDWQNVITGAIWTALRVLTALILSLALTVPVGVSIGRNPRLAQFLQPLLKIATSVPATVLFSVLLLGFTQITGALLIGSIVLMMLGTMWYVLFNAIVAAYQSFSLASLV